MPEAVKDDLRDLALDDDINVRMRTAERERLDRAAIIVSRQRRAIIKPGTFAREVINAAVDRVLDEAGSAPAGVV